MWEFISNQLGQWEYIVRIILASACGSLIGLERSHRQKEAGVRTHLIVCLGACLMVVVSKYGFFDVIVRDSVQVDAARVASNVITGISFLCAGVIFVKGGSIRGLTTSAGLWATSAIGLAMGAGLYMVAIFTTALVIFLQSFLHKLLRWETSPNTEIRLVLVDKPDTMMSLRTFLDNNGIEVEEYSVKKNSEGNLEYDALIKHLSTKKTEELIDILRTMPDVKEFFCNQ